MSRTIDFRYAPSVIQTCIGRVDDEYKTIVREDGSLNYGFGEGDSPGPNADPALRPEHDTLGFRHRIRPKFTHEDELHDRYQEYGDPGAAIVRTVEEYADTHFEWTAFSYAEPKYHKREDRIPVQDDGTPLRADLIRWTLRADDSFGHARSKVHLELDGESEDLPEIYARSDIADETTDVDIAQPKPMLEGGEVWEGAFVILREGELDPETVTVEWADEALEATREYWDDLEVFRNELRVPDRGVNEMLTACGRNILQAREIKDGVPEYQVGPTVYRGLWIVDGHFLLEAAHMMGRGDEAFEQGLLALQRRAKPSGAIQNLAGHDKETGIAMATVVRQCELADDDDRLEELWPMLRRGLEFLEEQHERAREMGPDYEARELFPPAFVDGGISGPFPDYTTPLWILAGLRHAARAGRRLDLDGHEDFRAFYEEIREGFQTCAERDVRETHDGIEYLPMNMVDREYDTPQTATWAFAHAIYPGEVFDPKSEYVQRFLELLDSVDDEEGIPKNTGWIHDQGVWGYSAMFYANVWLYAGHPEKAVDYLYAFANHAAPSRVWREEQSLRDTHAAEIVGDMPHNWASAEFIRMVRNLLVFETEGRLELLPGLPDEWLPEDASLVVEATPTKYGPVDLELDWNEDHYELTYARVPGNKTPADVRVHWDGDIVEAPAAVERLDETTLRIEADQETATILLS